MKLIGVEIGGLELVWDSVLVFGMYYCLTFVGFKEVIRKRKFKYEFVESKRKINPRGKYLRKG